MPADDLRIRWARPDDAEVIHRFVCELARFEREPDAVEVTADTYRKQLLSERPPFECLIAETATPVGFALFFGTYSTWRGRPGIHLEDVYVPPEHRGRGVGSALLRRLARVAVERGCGRLEWAVLDWNQPAIDFYDALGATAMAEWLTYRLEGDALRAVAGKTP